MRFFKDFTVRLITLIIRSEGEYCELMNAIALILVGVQFGYWHTFGLPIWAAVTNNMIGITQIVGVSYDHKLVRTYAAGASLVVWIGLASWVTMTDRTAISIVFMMVFALGSLFTYIFQGIGGGNRYAK